MITYKSKIREDYRIKFSKYNNKDKSKTNHEVEMKIYKRMKRKTSHLKKSERLLHHRLKFLKLLKMKNHGLVMIKKCLTN